MSRSWTFSRAYRTALAISKICAGGIQRAVWPLTDLATGNLAKFAHLDSLAKIGVGECLHNLIFGVLTVLFYLLLIALPID
jgi:hypothetical protein